PRQLRAHARPRGRWPHVRPRHPRTCPGAHRGAILMTIYVARDAAAASVGGGRELAQALRAEAGRRGIELDLRYTGSRGLYWLEPMVEVDTPSGRVAYGPVAPGDLPGLFEAGFLEGGAHPLRQGLTAEIPYLARQERIT